MAEILKIVLVAEGKTYADLAMALDHATTQLRMGTPSENVTWDDDTHVDFQVCTIDQKDSYAASTD